MCFTWNTCEDRKTSKRTWKYAFKRKKRRHSAITGEKGIGKVKWGGERKGEVEERILGEMHNQRQRCEKQLLQKLHKI